MTEKGSLCLVSRASWVVGALEWRGAGEVGETGKVGEVGAERTDDLAHAAIHHAQPAAPFGRTAEPPKRTKRRHMGPARLPRLSTYYTV